MIPLTEAARAIPCDQLLADARRITAINRRYLVVETPDGQTDIDILDAQLEDIAELPADQWSGEQTRLVVTLAALGAARIRLEQVGMSLDPDTVQAQLRATHRTYLDHLHRVGAAPAPDPGQPSPNPVDGVPWPELPTAIRSLRDLVDHHYHRILEIDGETYLRRELLLPRATTLDVQLPATVQDRLAAIHPDVNVQEHDQTEDYLRTITLREIHANGDPLRVLEVLMRSAADDLRHPSDHATLMCPRGTHLRALDTIGKEDFAILVAFRTGFEPATELEVGDRATIQRAMYAHHAAKKGRIARRLYGETGRYTPNDMSDDLGSLGIYFNEHAHHKGHVVSGVSSAMRSLMAITFTDANGRATIHDLTDWRLSRMSRDRADRYHRTDYPSFFQYGAWIRIVVETVLSAGILLPKMMGEWR